MRRTLIIGLMLAAAWATQTQAAQTRRWIVDTAKDLLKGRGDGVAVTTDGRLEGVDRWSAIATLDEPVVVAGGLDADGSLVVGTGHPANLYRIGRRGAELLTAVPGEQVTAVLPTPDGILVATVAPGVLWRWRDGRLEEIGRLGEGGIWDLAVHDGVVIAAAGSPGGLFRLGPRGFSRWLEVPDVHARCLATADGTLLVGTSGKGLILGIDRDGRMSLLVDSPFTEISDMVATGDGSVWAVALVGEPPESPTNGKSAAKANGEGDDGSATTEAGSLDLDLPKVNGGTASSELVRVTPEGALLSIHRFSRQVASAVARDGDGVLVGTGFEGEVWRFVDDGGARLASVDAVQVVGIVGDGEILLAQGPAAVLRRAPGGEPGRFRSEAMRFPRPMRFGEYRVDPPVDGLRIRFRTGASDKPDESWLPWTEWTGAATGRLPLPAARSVQWEIELAPGDLVDRIEVAMAEINLPPRLTEVSVEDPGTVYLAAPPPSGPVVDAMHPDINGVFTVIDESTERAAPAAKGKKFYRVGYRTVSWQAEDPNEDPMRFDLEVERRDGHRLPVVERIEGTQLAVDTTAIPDGLYRFVVTASDGPQNPGAALSATASSRWFTVDNTPPRLEVRADGDLWQVRVSDASSPIAQVEWSRNGDRWHPLAPADGVLDGTVESFEFPRQGGRGLVVVRAIDRHHNRATEGVVED
ncbi:MAG: hypothetical protein MUC56_01325 [Thermoanaerobaculales bacterium]|jgi:hypothetical protein|nr:hypothetical protein [Thermoanaerobaculales bacterium]